MSTPTRGNFIFGIVFVLVFGGLLLWRQMATLSSTDIAASDLAAFSQGLSLEQALERSAQTGRPVLVYATASWCGPCRGFKAQTLSRDDVASAITDSFEPVYLDIDHSGGDARTLRVNVVPTLIILRDGQQVDRHEGAMPTAAFLAFLNSHASPAPAASPDAVPPG